MENLSIDFKSTVKEIQNEVAKAIKLQKWPEAKAKRVYNKAVSNFIIYLSYHFISNLGHKERSLFNNYVFSFCLLQNLISRFEVFNNYFMVVYF